ncbi:MAG: acetate kinase [Fibrobacteres bacterium]|nr:acetate kinase [Fibrobacterota bacterium]
MKILVLNCGSSSIKFQFLSMTNERLICKGGVERIGTNDAILAYEAEGCSKRREVKPVADHTQAIENIISLLLSSECGVIKEKSEIKGIGHRVVHGGEEFSDSVLIDSKVIDCIRKFSTFAPLHNPANLRGIEVCSELLPGIPQVAVFDTAFHHNMPEKSFVYPIPYEYYVENGVRRYGFHGTSHKFVSNRAAEIIGKPVTELKIITCHLGNGCSIAAIDKGVSVDTTMGFTPLEGLAMGTRSGDIDPAIIFFLMEKLSLSSKDMDNMLNKKSGLLGVSGTSNDMREVTAEADKGSKRHQLAIDIFCHRVRKYIGAYAAVMGGVDAVVFTGGIGENGPHVRRKVCSDMEFFGIKIDEALNVAKGTEVISTGKTKVMVISTNEELTIARDTRAIVEKLI